MGRRAAAGEEKYDKTSPTVLGVTAAARYAAAVNAVRTHRTSSPSIRFSHAARFSAQLCIRRAVLPAFAPPHAGSGEDIRGWRRDSSGKSSTRASIGEGLNAMCMPCACACPRMMYGSWLISLLQQQPVARAEVLQCCVHLLSVMARFAPPHGRMQLSLAVVLDDGAAGAFVLRDAHIFSVHAAALQFFPIGSGRLCRPRPPSRSPRPRAPALWPGSAPCRR